MGFWGGIRKVIDGLNEVAESPTEIARDFRARRVSGRYDVTIQKFGIHPGNLVAKITYHGSSNTHDIDHIGYVGQTRDIWDELTEEDRIHINYEILEFLMEMRIKKGAD